MAFLFEAFRISDDPGQEAHGRVNHRLGRDLAAGHDKIAERNLFDPVVKQHPVIKPFKTATDHGDPTRF